MAFAVRSSPFIALEQFSGRRHRHEERRTLVSRSMDASYVFLIVGAGFSGAVIAERLARVSGKRSIVR